MNNNLGPMEIPISSWVSARECCAVLSHWADISKSHCHCGLALLEAVKKNHRKRPVFDVTETCNQHLQLTLWNFVFERVEKMSTSWPVLFP